MCDDSYAQVLEEAIDGFDVYIEPNPDQYRGGYIWSVSKEDAELDSGLVFSINEVLNEVLKCIALQECLN